MPERSTVRPLPWGDTGTAGSGRYYEGRGEPKAACNVCPKQALLDAWRYAAQMLAIGHVATEVREDLHKREREARQAGDAEEAAAWGRVRREL